MFQNDREVIILVGMQGAGKTFYCETVLPNYKRISQDEGPRSYRGIVLRLEELLREGVPRIVIDRTNPMRHQRQQFAELARAAEYRLKIIYLATPVEICRERIRNRKGHPTLASDKMQEAMALYTSRLNIPVPEECDELVVISQPFVASAPASSRASESS
jgi:predicted kinase